MGDLDLALVQCELGRRRVTGEVERTAKEGESIARWMETRREGLQEGGREVVQYISGDAEVTGFSIAS